jgi:hypothetical protein
MSILPNHDVSGLLASKRLAPLAQGVHETPFRRKVCPLRDPKQRIV